MFYFLTTRWQKRLVCLGVLPRCMIHILLSVSSTNLLCLGHDTLLCCQDQIDSEVPDFCSISNAAPPRLTPDYHPIDKNT